MDLETITSQLTSFFDGFQFNSPSLAAIIALILAGFLLLVSGFTSASEIAFFSLSPSNLKSIEDEEHKSDKVITELLGDSERLLATILVTNNFVNVTLIVLCNYFFMNVVKFTSPIAEFVILTVALTFLLLLFGEIMPKIFSVQNTLRYCRFAAPTILLFSRLFRPVSSILVKSSDFLKKRLRKRKNYNISVDELSHALELTDKTEISEENTILQGIIRFGGETAKEVMTSRLDMVDLDISTPYKEVLKCIIENVYSRIPVYNKTRDNIVGVLYIKDLLPHLSKGDFFRWQSIIRPAYFVPETKMIDDLLRDFQSNKVHMAIVVDEFGGTSGLITMEDIIEEIVGEINDEYDEEEKTFKRLDKFNWVFEAKTGLPDFFRETLVDESEFEKIVGGVDTVGGLLLEIKGEFPALNETVMYADRYSFTVLEKDDRRILKVKFSINPDVLDRGDLSDN